MNTVLVPTDFTHVSCNVFPLAVEIAKRYGHHFAVLHASDAIGATADMRQAAVQKMRTLVHDHDAQELSYRCYLRFGEAGRCIARLTRQFPTSFVVIGKRRGDGWSGTVYHAVCHSDSPVLAVPHYAHRNDFQNILFASTSLRKEDDIVRQATEFAALFNAQLTLLEITRKPVAPDTFKQEAVTYARSLQYARLAYRAVQAGDISKGLAEYLSSANPPDLLCVGRSSDLWLVHPLRRNLIGQLLSLTDFPLLFFNNETDSSRNQPGMAYERLQHDVETSPEIYR